MMNLIYGKDRIEYPLIRTGPRGSGEFRKVSWEEALDFTAQKLKKITEKYGSDSVALTVQVPGTGYVHKGAFVRLAGLAHWTIHHGYDQNGDLPMFWPMTFGVQTEELESLEWPNARYTMVFGSNIIQTRLPDAKQLISAKNNGKLVVFDPDYCSTAAKADEWVPLKPDTDAAMALGMAIKGDNGWDGEIGQNDLQTLQNSYVSLFINALPEVPCPPYGSVYLEGALMGGSTIRVRNLYLEYGFQTEEMADHIAVEFEFLAFLTTLSNDDPPREDYDFLLDHLSAWTPEFFDRVENKDEIGFYRDVSRYAKSVIFRASQA